MDVKEELEEEMNVVEEEEVKGPMAQFLESIGLGVSSGVTEEEETVGSGSGELIDAETRSASDLGTRASSPRPLTPEAQVEIDLPDIAELSPEPDFPDIREIWASATQPSNTGTQVSKGKATKLTASIDSEDEVETDDKMEVDYASPERTKSPGRPRLSKTPLAVSTGSSVSPLASPSKVDLPVADGGYKRRRSDEAGPNIGGVGDADNHPDQDDGEKDEEEVVEQPNSPKKSRLSYLTAASKQTRRRNAEFWHLDGSVVVQVEQELFRLHGSMLQRKSNYFARVMQKKREIREQVDGKPLYKVLRLKATDFERLLIALEDGILYAQKPPSFEILASILRAATRLDFSAIHSWAVTTFEVTFPPALEAITPLRRVHAAETVLLARECGVTSVLKGASYELLRTAGFGLKGFCAGDDDDYVGENFSREDIQRLIETREKLVAEWVSFASKPIAIICHRVRYECAGAHDHDNLLAWNHYVLSKDLVQEYLYDPLSGIETLLDIKWDEKFCGDCCKEMHKAFTSKRTKIWELLDVYLELPRDDSG